MAVTASGVHSSRYEVRQDYALRCVAYQRGDRSVIVDGVGPYCIIIDREFNKIDLDDVGINSSTIEAVWVTSDNIAARKGSKFVSGDITYTARNSPANQFDGWTSVQLQICKC